MFFALLLACVPVPAAPALREAWRWPFAADSPWNLPVGEGLLLEDASASCSGAVTDLGVDAWVNAETWSHPVVRSRVSDPLVGVYLDGSLQIELRVPVNATPSLPAWPEGDAHLHVVDPDGARVVELWRARPRPDGGWDVDALAENDLRGAGIGDGGVRIYGGSAFAGLWRSGESQQGAGHALALSLPLAALAPRVVWPATDLDTSRTEAMTGIVPIGQHVALPANLDLDTFTTREGRALATALRDYGAYVVDHASGFALYAEPDAVEEAEGMRADIAAIRGALRCSVNSTEATPGGPGTRVADAAPDFAED